MKNKLIFIISLLISIILLVMLLYSFYNIEKPIGGQRDEHGCLGPAGYSYNETLKVCVREWELDYTKRYIIQENIKQPEYGLTIIEVLSSQIKLDVLGEQKTINISPILSPEECLELGGRNLNIVAGDTCYENETNIGKVVGFISPNICCVPILKNSSCGCGK